jgi:hypothetical protein
VHRLRVPYTRFHTRRCFCVALLAGLAVGSPPSLVFAWGASPDVTIELAGGLVRPSEVVDDGGAPSPLPVDLGPLPAGSDVIAYATDSGGAAFFVLAQATTLPGAIQAGPRVIIRWDSGVYSVELDLGASGLSAGVAVDALGILDSVSSVGISFDEPTVVLGAYVDDADVLDLFTLNVIFDASAAGVAAGADLDALSEAPGSGDLIVSFDVGGTVGGVTYADEDLLRVSLPGPTFSMEVDASAVDASWGRADVDAVQFVPEPSGEMLLLFGSLALALQARRRASRRVPEPELVPEEGAS